MPEINPINQSISITLHEKIAGDDIGKHLKTVQAALAKTQKAIKKYDGQWERHAKTIKASIPNVDRYTKGQERLSRAVNASLEPMRKQSDLLKKTRREMASTERVSQSLGRSLTKLGGLLGIGGLGFLATRRIREIANQRFNLALMGGADQIRLIQQLTGGRGTTHSIDLAARFQAQSPYARFGLGDQSLKGLVSLQRKLEGVGADMANDLILGVTQSLEPDRLRSFLQAAGAGDVRRALMGAATGGNIEAVTSALNALQIGELKGTGQLDPMLEEASRFRESAQRIEDAFDRLATKVASDLLPVIEDLTGGLEKVAGWIGKLSTGELLGLGAGIYGAGKILDVGLTALMLRGLGFGRGGAKGFRMPPASPGFPPRGFPGGGGFGIPGMRPALPGGQPMLPGRFAPKGLGPSGFPVISPLRLPAGGLVGYGLAAGAAAASLATLDESYGVKQDERKALEAIQSSMSDRRLVDVARKNRASATSDLDRLRAKRQEIDAMLLAMPAGGIKPTDSGIFSRDNITAGFSKYLGLTPDLPQVNPAQIDRLRQQRADISRQIKALQSSPGGSGISDIFAGIKTGFDKAASAAGRFKTGLDNVIESLGEANVRRLQEQAARMRPLQLAAGEASARTQLSRLDFESASASIFGPIGGFSEFKNLQVQLNQEIESLTEVMHNIDTNTAEGRIEAMQLNAQIKSLRLESKQRSIQMTQAMLDGVVSQAFNAGRFSKIIFNQSQNLRKGLDLQAITPHFPQITGSLKPSGRRPTRLNAAGNAIDAVKNLSRAANDLVGYLEDIVQLDDAPNATRPGRSGTSALN